MEVTWDHMGDAATCLVVDPAEVARSDVLGRGEPHDDQQGDREALPTQRRRQGLASSLPHPTPIPQAAGAAHVAIPVVDAAVVAVDREEDGEVEQERVERVGEEV
eukprot:2828313-Prymnesium_polylepis.2